MRLNEELQNSCYKGEGKTADSFVRGRKNCTAVVVSVKEEIHSSSYGGEIRTA